jgi:branched-chain amino acid transport system substrate-binding protein
MRKRVLLVPALALSSLLIIACPPKESGSGGGEAAGANEIPIGEYGSLTGNTASFGQSTHNGVILAVEEINNAGGVNGRKLKLFTEDDQSKPEEAANAVSKLISQKQVVAVIGEVASSRSLAAAPICQANKIPMITPSSTNPEVTKKGDYIFRVCFIDPYQGQALARFVANDLKLKRTAILRDVKNDYSVGLANFFAEEYKKLGGQIVGDQSYSEGDSDFRAQLTALKSGNPEVLFVPGYYTEIGQIARQARDLGIKQPLVGGDGWESPRLIEIGGEALNGSYYANHYFVEDPNPSVQDFVKKYQAKHGNEKPDSMAALGYDATMILADAMRRAGSTDGAAIRDQIAKTVNYKGVTGTISIDPERNAQKPLVIIEIRDGKPVFRTAVPPPGGEATPAATPQPAAPATATTTGT